MVRIGRLEIEISMKGVEKVKGALKGMASNVKNFASRFKTEFRLLGVAFAAFVGLITKEAAKFERAMLSLQFVSQRTGRDFDEVRQIIVELQKQMGGMASQAEIASGVMRLMTTSLDTDQIKRFIQAIQDGSTAMGQDFAQQLDVVIRGFKQLNTASLDNIGANIRLNELYSRTAKSLGKTRDELTNLEIEQSIYNEVIKQTEKFQGLGAKAAETFSGQLNVLRIDLKDMSGQLQNQLLPDLKDLIKSISENKDTLLLFGETGVDVFNTLLHSVIALGKVMEGVFGAFSKAVDKDFKGAVTELRQGFGELIIESQKVAESAADIFEINTRNNKTFKELKESLDKQTDSVIANTAANQQNTESVEDRAKAVQELINQLDHLRQVDEKSFESFGLTPQQLRNREFGEARTTSTGARIVERHIEWEAQARASRIRNRGYE